MTESHERYRRFLEALTPETLPDLAALVTDDVHFADPFNDVRGRDAMLAAFRDMFDQLGSVRFTVHRAVSDGDACLMHWTFTARLRGRPWEFDGMSIAAFAADGRVCEHMDHWDAARHFYEHLPVVGWPLARIRKRLAVH